MVLCILFFLAFSTTQEAKVLRGKIAYVQVREGCSKEVASAPGRGRDKAKVLPGAGCPLGASSSGIYVSA